LVDIAAVTELAHAAGAKVVLDNVFATPLLQQGFPLGVDVVVYSGTKHIDGQGRVLGGAILGDKEYIDGPVQKLMRHTGPAMSAFNAWVMLKGLETLAIRVDYQNAAAQRIAEYLEGHSAVRWVRYPFLTSHPQYDLAKRQMSGGGTVVTFELDVPDSAAKHRAFEVLDKHPSGDDNPSGDGTRRTCGYRVGRRGSSHLGGIRGNRRPDRRHRQGLELGVC
jgi:O-succinylhomoserine sulfhydrylase